MELAIDCADEAATARLGEALGLALRRGDLVTLSGDLGAGKTALARATIRTAVNDAATEVPSPTFTLVQTYDDAFFGPLAHLDLYRIEGGAGLDELGLDDILEDGAALVEWPERAGDALPDAALSIAIEQTGDTSRRFVFTGTDAAMDRLRRSIGMRGFLDAQGLSEKPRRHLVGDASARSYELIDGPDGPLVAMNAPEAPDGEILPEHGAPYSRVAHLAEHPRAFVAVALALSDAGFTAPDILAHDLAGGYMLTSWLGDGQIIDGNRQPLAERYEGSIDLLAAQHGRDWNPALPVPGGEAHTVPPFDHRAMAIETSLYSDWYLPRRLGRALTTAERDAFAAIWQTLFDRIEGKPTLVLRDFHSPNIIWRDGKSGLDRVGLIDFQDALIGPAAYDVASLAQDARVDVSATLEAALVERYIAAAEVDAASFRTDYAIMAAQRATKVAGIFVRLHERDGKSAYLAHLPRMEDYLTRSLAHPVLADYRAWLEGLTP